MIATERGLKLGVKDQPLEGPGQKTRVSLRQFAKDLDID